MAGTVENNVLIHGFGRLSNWQGRSGRTYGLVSENVDHFAMGDSDLYLIAKGSHVLWVGSTNELVSDPMSRTRFRLALDCADRAFRLLSPAAATQRMATIWDLEGAEPAAGAQAA
ncbi:MAG: hypothetical protein ACK4G5_03505 [Devosia sp.]|jgi:hypothetical protein|uniref:hypothetical protein n=1 Tax=Devosia sp. XGJD_8 TaxID=3391187 RepID=UPI001D5AC533|nr:hypothetical protein [Alphaproteobacteria bacterium]MBU1561320.1 hypothetical protein [Alphaproteobacteria bacterium]MBU2303864.1 hypothetical protein [Alphaproteobacteria bacterium]MBU2367755.1 hypothetical protein [Alphaproteobacteria bacterium]